MASHSQPDGHPTVNPPQDDPEPMEQDAAPADAPYHDPAQQQPPPPPPPQHPAPSTENNEAPQQPQPQPATQDTQGETTNTGDNTEETAQNEQQPSPPPPTRHTPAAPGPRAARLQELYAQRLRRTLAKLGWANFAGCYPTVANKAEGVLRQVQAQMVDKLGEKCEKEFENIMVARQVVPKLNDLEHLIGDAAARRAEAQSTSSTDLPTPPHLLPPDSILAAHLHPALAAHQSQLNARLQTTQSQNALLHDQVRRQREQIAELLDRLDVVVADVRGANDALRPVVDELAAETREGLLAVEAAGQKL